MKKLPLHKGGPAKGAQAGHKSSTQQFVAQQAECPSCGYSFDAAKRPDMGDKADLVPGSGLQNAKAKAKKMIMSYQQMNGIK